MSRIYIKKLLHPGKPQGLFLLGVMKNDGGVDPLPLDDQPLDEETEEFVASVVMELMNEGSL
jgi:hypothetical protein